MNREGGERGREGGREGRREGRREGGTNEREDGKRLTNTKNHSILIFFPPSLPSLDHQDRED